MENKILSLDLGTNSIGATIRNLTEENQFEKTTVITFETGVGKDKENKYTISHAANRTSKRSIRRLYQARKYKLWATLEILAKNKKYCPINEQSIKRWKHYDKEEAHRGNGGRKFPIEDLAFANWIKLDFNNDNIPDYTSPYQLREELATVKLDFEIEENRFKLGRALYHIAQHRGFKSSKKIQNKDEENSGKESETDTTNIGAEGKKEDKFFKQVEKLGFEINADLPVGVILSIIERDGIQNENRKTEGIRIRKELHQYVTRKMLMREVQTIFKQQGLSFGSIFKNKKGEELKINQSSIFWQRPLRSQKGTIGKCTLETSKYRCPASRPEFEEFRALSFINNIQFRLKNDKKNEWKQLELNLRKQLFEEKCFVQKDFEFYGIYKWLQKKNGHDNWELNFNFKTNVSACTVSARMKNIFGEQWNNIEVRKDKKYNEYKISAYEDIWHVLFESNDEDFISEYGRTKLKLDDEQIKKLIALWYAMPVSYGNLSLKAINNILPFLREGFIYTEATLLAKVPEVLGEKIWSANKELITKSLKQDVIASNRDEKRLLNIVNNLIAQYKSLPEDEKYAVKDYDYKIDGFENKKIAEACLEAFGKETWKEKNEEERSELKNQVANSFQSFFLDKERSFKKLPHLLDSMKQFLIDHFDFIECKNLNEKNLRCNTCETCKRINKLYHPSQIEIYPPAKSKYYKDLGRELTLLGSPQTGALKNPMAMRAMHELKKFINYLITTGQIDESTRIVIELARELNDTNRRWAYEKYQQLRAEENKEFALAILELLKDPKAQGSLANPNSDSDIDKFRLWYEMIEDMEGYEKSGKFIENIKEIKTRKKKGKEEEFEEFEENNFEKINKSLYFKLKKAKDNVLEKYKLWKEQEYKCLYTGKMIGITDLFKENEIDFEHTIPRSMSFDNSLANRTVCYADYNRNIKKNQIPFNLPNYEKAANGYDAIKPRIEKWERKVRDLNLHVEFWKGQSKRASTIERKNNCIRQKHLWYFELDYWENKVSRFTMKEVKAGFKNSQLKDTQIISKYAMHYLKTFFNKVDVQKGSVTADFRKIFGVQEIGTEKDRSKHSHHAKDAITLSLIPQAALRDNILKIWYKCDEEKQLLKSHTENDKQTIQGEINRLQEELNQLVKQCNLPNVNAVIDQVDEQILINNISKDQSLTASHKRIRHRGKIVPFKDKLGNIIYKTDADGNKKQRKLNGKLVWKNNEFGKPLLDKTENKIPVYEPLERWAKGDTIRGQLHKDTFYGKIKRVEKDKDGKFIRDEKKDFVYEFDKKKNDFVYAVVVRKEVDKMKESDVEKIVDTTLRKIIIKQIGDRTLAATLNQDGGLFMLKKDGTRAHKIRHIRCYADDVSDPIGFKAQTFQGPHPHKNFYWANNGENIVCALFQKTIKDKKGIEKIDRDLEIITLKDAADLLSLNKLKEKNGKRKIELYREEKDGLSEKPYALLKPGMKVIFYGKEVGELKTIHHNEIAKRTYKVMKFSGGRITFGFHLDAIPPSKLTEIAKEKGDKSYATGYSKVDLAHPQPRLLLSKNSLNMAIEGIHFEMKPDGEIFWKL